MGASGTVARHEADLVRRCYAGLDNQTFQAETVRAIHALLPVDAVFLATADPATLLFTGATAEEPLAAATAAFLDNEFGGTDVNKFQSLATAARPVATLDTATAGQRTDSPRYREIMSPMGLGDELRAALVTPAGCFGYLCLHRGDSPYGFTPAEAQLVARIAPHLGNGIRHSLATARSGSPGLTAPGVVVLHPDLTVAAMTGEAEHWLSTIAASRPDPGRLPIPVYAVAAQLRNLDGTPGRPAPTVRVPTRTGGWLLIHAAHLSGNPDGNSGIAVIVEPAHPDHVAPLLLATHGLTPREGEVALLVLRGESTRAIGAELHLSDYTVKDHLKSIFDKIGVHSRRDLVAEILSGRPPTAGE